MEKAFNLNRYHRKAFYDDARGHMLGQTRAWTLCYKAEIENKKTPQEAWDKCRDVYQESNQNDNWSKYLAN